MKVVRIGTGAGYSGDRIEPAVELADKGRLDYLVFECLGERTLAIAQAARRKNPEAGYDPLLADRMRAVLPLCAKRKTRIISNMGAANPVAAQHEIKRIARELGLKGMKIAAVTGDDLIDVLRDSDLPLIETTGRVADIAGSMVSANAYLGAGPIADALAAGADIVVTGRVGDPALFLAPLMHEFGWARDDWKMLGRGTVVGHLLECAGQITGGYFADPGFKDVEGLARLGFPLAEVAENGDTVVTKVEGSGGAVTLATCKEQLLYEVHDPSRYLQPDVIADFSGVELAQVGPDRVAVSGGSGRRQTDTLKVSIGFLDGYIGEGQISYVGSGALERGRLALRIVEERLKITGLQTTDLRFDLIGFDSSRKHLLNGNYADPPEIRVRVAGRCISFRDAQRIGEEVETLYTNGPAGGGGATKSVEEVFAIASTLIPRDQIHPQISYEIA